MKKLELIKEIEDEIKKCATTIEQEDEILSFLEDFINDSHIDQIKDYSKINYINLIISHLITRSDEKDFQEIKETISGISNMINPYEEIEFKEFVLYTLIAILSKESDSIVEVLESPNSMKKTIKLKTIIDQIDKFKEYEETGKERILQYIEQDEESFTKYMKYLKNHTYEVSEALKLVAKIYEVVSVESVIHNKMQNVNNDIEEDIEKEKYVDFSTLPSRIQKRIYKRVNKKARKFFVSYDQVNEKLREIVNYKLEREKSMKSSKKKAMKTIGILKEVKERIQTDSEKELLQIPFLNKTGNDNLELTILKYMYEHNLELYNETEKEYHRLGIDEQLEYRKEIESSGIEIDEEGSILYQYSLQELKQILPILGKIEIKRISDLNDMTKETLDFYLNMINNQEMTLRFINEHKEVLQEERKQKIKKNREFLLQKRINVKTWEEKQTIYLIEPKTLEKNISTLEEYELLDIKNSEDISYLSLEKEELQNRIDRILELGYEEILEEHKDLLNYSLEDWDRIQVLKDLDFEIDTKEKLLVHLKEKNPIISTEKVKKYMTTIRNDEEKVKVEKEITEEQLKKFSDTRRCYKIGNLYFSKKKVERNYKQSNDYYQALRKNRKLNVEEQNTIKEEMQNKVYMI